VRNATPYAESAVSEHLLIGITISIAASLVAGGFAGAMKGLYTIHSGRTLRALIICDNVWVIIIIASEALQVVLAFGTVSTKDFVLICLIFVLTLPSLSWIYTHSGAAAEAVAVQLTGKRD
jgi:hypothetical protein